MSLKDNLESEVKTILDWDIKIEDTQNVPSKSTLTLGRTAQRFTTAVLYTDVRSSSKFPELHRSYTVAKIFNAFLNGAVRIIRDNNGHIRSFNGDSILAFFDPKLENPSYSAVATAMKLVYFVDEILKPRMAAKRYDTPFDIGAGVTYGQVIATKIGIRGEQNNDIIWPSTVTNMAAKLGDKGSYPYRIRVSKPVFDLLPDDMKWKPYNNIFEQLILPRTEYWDRESFKFAGETQPVYKSNYRMEL